MKEPKLTKEQLDKEIMELLKEFEVQQPNPVQALKDRFMALVGR